MFLLTTKQKTLKSKLQPTLPATQALIRWSVWAKLFSRFHDEFRLHRTKCGALIRNVIYPECKIDLLQDIGQSSYSLIIDESTDVGDDKQLCVMIRYFSTTLQEIVSTFLGIMVLQSGNAEAIFTAILDFLADNHIDTDECVGLGTDGCNAMCGEHNSLISRMKEMNPNIVHIKCICHSIQLCSSYDF